MAVGRCVTSIAPPPFYDGVITVCSGAELFTDSI